MQKSFGDIEILKKWKKSRKFIQDSFDAYELKDKFLPEGHGNLAANTKAQTLT